MPVRVLPVLDSCTHCEAHEDSPEQKGNKDVTPADAATGSAGTGVDGPQTWSYKRRRSKQNLICDVTTQASKQGEKLLETSRHQSLAELDDFAEKNTRQNHRYNTRQNHLSFAELDDSAENNTHDTLEDPIAGTIYILSRYPTLRRNSIASEPSHTSLLSKFHSGIQAAEPLQGVYKESGYLPTPSPGQILEWTHVEVNRRSKSVFETTDLSNEQLLNMFSYNWDGIYEIYNSKRDFWRDLPYDFETFFDADYFKSHAKYFKAGTNWTDADVKEYRLAKLVAKVIRAISRFLTTNEYNAGNFAHLLQWHYIRIHRYFRIWNDKAKRSKEEPTPFSSNYSI